MATIKDIAEAVGVSIGTVDRILHKRGRYSEKTAEKVRKVMEELHYRPNIHGRGLKKTRSHSFAAVIPRRDQDGGYWQLVEEGIMRASETLGSYGSEVHIFPFDRYSSASCLSALRAAKLSGVEGLLAAPVRPADFRAELAEGDLPYLFIDTDIPEMPDRISCIGQDSHQSGILSGKLMNLMLSRYSSDRHRVLVVDPPGSNLHLISRIEGFTSYMRQNRPEVELIRIKEDADEEEQILHYLEDFFSRTEYLDGPLPGGIFVANTSVYYMASYLKNRGGEYPAIPLIGYDLIPGKESLIEEGIIDFILTQQPEEQGYHGIMMLYEKLILGKTTDSELITPLHIITKENLHSFINYRKD